MRSLISVAAIVFAAVAEAGSWTRLAPVIEPRQEVAVAVAHGRIYLMGGIGDGRVLSTVEEYDPSTDRWRLVAPLPEPLHHSAAATVDDQIYVIGGFRTLAFDATDAVYRYDPFRDHWSAVSRLPARRGALAAATIGRTIYAVGGAGPTGELAAYTIETDSWIVLAPMPSAREHLIAGVIEGKLYVAGGRRPNVGGLANLEVYDPATNLWSVRASMPSRRSGIAAAVFANQLYVFGGEGNPQSPLGVFALTESYDPIADRWRAEAPMPVARHGIGAAVIGERIYIPAGAEVAGFGVSAVHEAFAPGVARRRRSARRF